MGVGSQAVGSFVLYLNVFEAMTRQEQSLLSHIFARLNPSLHYLLEAGKEYSHGDRVASPPTRSPITNLIPRMVTFIIVQMTITTEGY